MENKCGAECQVYSRVTGYHRPVENWNEGKTEEYKQRTVFVLSKSKLMHPIDIQSGSGTLSIN